MSKFCLKIYYYVLSLQWCVHPTFLRPSIPAHQCPIWPYPCLWYMEYKKITNQKLMIKKWTDSAECLSKNQSHLIYDT